MGEASTLVVEGIAKFGYITTFFFAHFAYNICKETLIDMCCLSSMTDLNLIVSFLSTLFFWLVKNAYFNPIDSPLSTGTKFLIGFFSVLSFITRSKSLAINSNSAHRLYQLLSIPITLIINFKKLNFGLHEYFSLTSFLVGCVLISTDSFDFNPIGALFGIGSSIVAALLVTVIQHASAVTGLSSLALQASVSVPRLLVSVACSAATKALPPWHIVSISLYPFPICLLVVASALDLAKTVSMTSEIASDSALSFLVVEKFCDILIILVGHTLNPTRFTTFSEAILSFVGFLLVLPGTLLFLIIGDKGEKRPTDVEPFRILPEDEKVDAPDEHSN